MLIIGEIYNYKILLLELAQETVSVVGSFGRFGLRVHFTFRSNLRVSTSVSLPSEILKRLNRAIENQFIDKEITNN